MIDKYENESFFEWKLRLCKSKLNKELDLDWQEIVDILGLDVSADHLRKTAYGLVEYDEYINQTDGVVNRILCLSDLHCPFQLPIDTYSDFVGRVDTLLLNGDILDMQAISKFPKTYRISPMEEIIMGREHLIELINYLSPKKVIVNYGNHDIRFANYLTKHLDTEVLELMPSTALELIFDDGFTHYDKRKGAKIKYEPIKDIFDDIEIEYTGDWKVKVGKTWFAHPLAYSSGTLKTCEKAMAYFHKTDVEDFDTVVLGHTHKTADGKSGNVVLIEQGACCDVDKMHYGDGRLSDPQKMGFLYICQNENGDRIDSKTKLIRLN